MEVSSAAAESAWVRAGGGGHAKIFCGQIMTFGYVSMTELTLRAIHVLVGRINYPTGRISQMSQMSQIIVQSVHNRLDFHHSLESSLQETSPRSAQALFLEASDNRVYVHN